MITRKQLISKYLDFFKSKNHKEIPNSSLLPEGDPTVLFTTAGMHPLVPFLLGQQHPLGKRLCNVQRCIRTTDIEAVGDSSHHTFFEMLGNWSLGDYFKEEAIKYSHEFLTKILKIPKTKISVTCFKGEDNIPKDEESATIWKKLGITKIKFLGKEDNWWGPAGNTGPCGPDTEMFYDGLEIWNDVFMQYNKDKRLILVDGMGCLYDENFNLNKELLEIINNFNTHTILTVNGFREKGYNLIKNYDSNKDTNWEAFSLEEKEIKKDNPEFFRELIRKFNLIPEEIIYFDHDKKNIESAKKVGIISEQYTDIKSAKKFIEKNLWTFIPLKQKNVDTGMGVERTLAVLNGFDDNYLTEVWQPIIKEIEKLSKKKYKGNEKTMRIIADHIKAASFIIADGISPSNTGQGYLIRRLIRRAVKYALDLEIKETISKIAEPVFNIYEDYSHLTKNKTIILEELKKEEKKFKQTLEKGINQFKKIAENKSISGSEAFLLYQSYGFPPEMIEEEAKKHKIKFSKKDFEQELLKHQELSRTASAGQFKSGLADHSTQTTKLHTASHLLLEALRIVLQDKDINQKGSNITPERLRLDFNFPRKLTEEEIAKIENLVNEQIKKSLNVIRMEVSLDEAKKIGARGVFEHKYGDKVSIYIIEDFSKEICTGPHVNNTKELGHFKITKEESSSSGVRRIKGIVE